MVVEKDLDDSILRAMPYCITELDVKTSRVSIKGLYHKEENAISRLYSQHDTKLTKVKENGLIKVYAKGTLYNSLQFIYQIIELEEPLDEE